MSGKRSAIAAQLHQVREKTQKEKERADQSGEGLENMFPIDPRQAVLASASNTCTAGIMTLHFPFPRSPHWGERGLQGHRRAQWDRVKHNIK